jgi:hypothetical protein
MATPPNPGHIRVSGLAGAVHDVAIDGVGDEQ